MFHLKSLLFVIALGGATLLHAAPEDSLIRPVQDRWAEIKYKTPEKQQAELYRELAVQAHQISKNNPNLAAALNQEGIVVSSEATTSVAGWGLSLAKDARTLLEESTNSTKNRSRFGLHQPGHALRQGAAPVGFGDKERRKRCSENRWPSIPTGLTRISYGPSI